MLVEGDFIHLGLLREVLKRFFFTLMIFMPSFKFSIVQCLSEEEVTYKQKPVDKLKSSTSYKFYIGGLAQQGIKLI